jgi:hypothetical protein
MIGAHILYFAASLIIDAIVGCALLEAWRK